MASSNAKIFGIGLSKTGTTSLANALQILGYKTKDNMGVVKYATGDLASVDLDIVDGHEALTDTPIPSFYRELDVRYPGSKFILTVRESESWCKSCKKQFTQRFAEVQTDAHKRLFMDLYGTDVFEDHGFEAGYERFVGGVREYFRGRPDDLLIIDVTAGEGWEKLCPFLGRAAPDMPFPKANVTQVRWMSIDDVVTIAIDAGNELLERYDGALDAKSSSSLTVKRIVARTMQTMLGEEAGKAAARAANRAIVKGLTRLNPQIPVLSRVGDPVAYPERKEWNHVWLVDPLDGEEAFARGGADFSVNIALIEDGRPICGVVHAPMTGETYYASAGRGAYRRTRGKTPVCLTPGQASIADVGGRSDLKTSTAGGSLVSSQALAMCLLAEARGRGEYTFSTSMEWQTAAAQAILNSAGLRVHRRGSGSELSYNKGDLSNGFVQVA